MNVSYIRQSLIYETLSFRRQSVKHIFRALKGGEERRDAGTPIAHAPGSRQFSPAKRRPPGR